MPLSSPGPGVPGAHLVLEPNARHVGQARRFAVEVTEQLGGDEQAQDVVRSLVSELVTNVVLHAGTEVVITVTDGDEHVRVEVADGSPALPLQRRVDGASTTGRGMRLLRTLSVASGFEADTTVAPAGKLVWFTVCKSNGAVTRAAVAAAATDLFGAEWDEAL